MAAVFDPILGKLRSHDFGDKEREEVRRLVESMSGDSTKEVVSRASLADLQGLEEKSTEVVYIAKDTAKIYLWDGTAFQDKTGSLVDNVIFVSDLDDLIGIELDPNKSYSVLRYTGDASGDGVTHDIDWGGYVTPPDSFGQTSIGIVCRNLGHEYNTTWFLSIKNQARETGIPIQLLGLSDSDYRMLIACRYIFENHVEHQPNEGLDHYVLTISASGKRYLDGKKGWAVADENEWIWNEYSYLGHMHEIQDINDLGETLDAMMEQIDEANRWAMASV